MVGWDHFWLGMVGYSSTGYTGDPVEGGQVQWDVVVFFGKML